MNKGEKSKTLLTISLPFSLLFGICFKAFKFGAGVSMKVPEMSRHSARCRNSEFRAKALVRQIFQKDLMQTKNNKP